MCGDTQSNDLNQIPRAFVRKAGPSTASRTLLDVRLSQHIRSHSSQKHDCRGGSHLCVLRDNNPLPPFRDDLRKHGCQDDGDRRGTSVRRTQNPVLTFSGAGRRCRKRSASSKICISSDSVGPRTQNLSDADHIETKIVSSSFLAEIDKVSSENFSLYLAP